MKIRNNTLTDLLGWVGWLAFCILSLLTRSGMGAAYLILLPLTGFIIRRLHRDSPRRLLSGNRRDERLHVTIATSSLKATKW